MATDVLLRQAVYYPIDAARVNMFSPWLRLEHILTEKVVLARYHPIVLNVEDLLWKVLTLAV